MTVAISSSKRIPWIGALVFLVIIWTLWSLELHSVRSMVGQAVSSDAVKLALETLSGTSPIESPVNPEKPAAIDAEQTDIIQEPAASTESAIAAAITIPPPITNPADLQDEVNQGVSDRPLILYAYSETESARINLEFFIDHGLHAGADFVFILNGATTASTIIPQTKNIRYIQRENDCYDLGAYAEVLTSGDLYKHYKKFIMLNSSLRGPFLPYWAESCWSDMYLKKVTDEVKLVGMTANCWPTFHVQSMIWATDDIGINLLLFPPEDAVKELSTHKSYDPITASVSDNPPQYPGINACFHTWGTAVAAEIGSSDLIRAAGYKLDVMMTAYHGNAKYAEECDSTKNGDVLFDGAYYGTNVHPFETIFLKSNRKIDPVGLERLTQWTKGRKYSSYDYCPA